MWVNLNGLPATMSTTNTQSVIVGLDAAGAPTEYDAQGVSVPATNLIAAYNGIYANRRVAWVKMRFIPQYNMYSPASAENQPIFYAQDSLGLTNVGQSITKAGLLNNVTGVKTFNCYKPFTIFKRSLSRPYAQKFTNVGASTGTAALTGDIGWENPSGQWINATDTALGQGSDVIFPHMLLYIPDCTFAAGEKIGELVFTIKYQWKNRRQV